MACQKDFIINRHLSILAGQLALTCGNALSVASASLIIAKNINFNGLLDKNAEETLEEIPQTNPQ